MVCNAETSRLNGAKSTGAITDRGKAIAARNATKHGLLSQKPPLLVTEDLETFEGMMQGLINEYQPQSPTEHLLIQQVAMAWLRLHRLWGVEAARANVEVLKAQAKVKYPQYDKPETLLTSYPYQPKPWCAAMREEKQAFEVLMDNLTYDLNQYPTKPTQSRKWLQQVDESLYQVRTSTINAHNQSFEHLKKAFWLSWDKLHWLIYDPNDDDSYRKPMTGLEVLKAAIQDVIEAAKIEVEAIARQLAEFEGHNQAIAQTEAISKGLQNPELFSRYERHITTQLNEALDRLAEINQQRHSKGSMGSFGQNVELSAADTSEHEAIA